MSRPRRKTSRPPEERRGVRYERCEECWRSCKRADAPIDTTYGDVKQGLESQVESGQRTGSQAWITPHTVLGRLFEMKSDAFARMIDECDHRGEHLPITIDDFLEWASQLRPLPVRIALGVSREAALRRKASLRLREIKAFYELEKQRVAQIPDMPEPDEDDEDLLF